MVRERFPALFVFSRFTSIAVSVDVEVPTAPAEAASRPWAVPPVFFFFSFVETTSRPQAVGLVGPVGCALIVGLRKARGRRGRGGNGDETCVMMHERKQKRLWISAQEQRQN